MGEVDEVSEPDQLREIILRASMRLAELSNRVEVNGAVARLRKQGRHDLADGVLDAVTTLFQTIDILAEARPSKAAKKGG